MTQLILQIYGWLIIGIVYTAVIHMAGGNLMGVKCFNGRRGLLIFGMILTALSIFALITGWLAAIPIRYLLATGILFGLGVAHLALLNGRIHHNRVARLLTSMNSPFAGLMAFFLAQRIVALIG